MSQKTFSATEVKNRFGRVLRDLSITGGPIIVEKDNKPVAVILSIEEYERMVFSKPLSLEQQQVVESSFGLWASRPDLDEEWLADGRSRWQSTWQNE
jgi:prevent-host-death family protein